MEFNAKKCKVLRVTRIRSIDDRDCYLCGIKLDRVDVEKDLGILVSHNLRWKMTMLFPRKLTTCFAEHARTFLK